jgi:hypothetical protein
MAAIGGPNIQVPGAASPLVTLLKRSGDLLALLTQEWATFFSTAAKLLWAGTRSGTTAQRPTSAVSPRWIGLCFFDTTLGKPVFLKSIGPDVWVDASGAVV